MYNKIIILNSSGLLDFELAQEVEKKKEKKKKKRGGAERFIMFYSFGQNKCTVTYATMYLLCRYIYVCIHMLSIFFKSLQTREERKKEERRKYFTYPVYKFRKPPKMTILLPSTLCLFDVLHNKNTSYDNTCCCYALNVLAKVDFFV